MDAKKLVEAIEDAGYEARSYSGRGMYGRRCVGVEISRGKSSFALAAEIAVALLDGDVDEGPNDVEALARLDVCEDSMGLGSIVYFPGVKWEDAGLEDDCDDEDEDGEEVRP